MTIVGAGLAGFAAVAGAGIVAARVGAERHAARIAAWTGAVAALMLLLAGGGALGGVGPLEVTLWQIPGIGPMLVRVDPLSGFFLLVTGLAVLPAAIFVGGRSPDSLGRWRPGAFAVLYLGLILSVGWVLVAADVFSFLLAWEAMSILCYLLVAGGDDDVEEAPRAAYLLLALGELGALAALVALLILARSAASLGFPDLAAGGGGLGRTARWAVFLLSFFGFGVKAGLVPVNVWLPRAYRAAPRAFVPVLAGATLNLGLYGILRVNGGLLSMAAGLGPGLVAVVVGTVTALVGILYATTETDLKALLAHSSVENAGIVTVGFGMGYVFGAAGRPALAAMAFLVALYHLLNHSLYKTLLFVGAGAVEERTGTRDLDQLGGLIRRMPWTAVGMLAGALSIAALPPFNGFVSEWLTFQTLLRSAELSSTGVKIVVAICGAGLALTAALAVTCFVGVFAMGFLGVTRSPAAESATETTPSARAAMGILGVGCLLLGILPTYTVGAIGHAVPVVAPGAAAAAELVPPFFPGSPGHESLPAPFVAEFHDLGAQLGAGLAPGPGLVLMHRGGRENPVVFAGAPTYLVLMLAGLLLLAFLVVARVATRRRRLARKAAWDGGIRRLLPEMTYTATGFANPVRVVFQAVFRPALVEDTRDTVAEHFRTAIRRRAVAPHIVDQLALGPVRAVTMGAAHLAARMHRGRLNAYLGYVLAGLLVALLLNGLG